MTRIICKTWRCI